MSYIIFTDSSSSLPMELIEKHNIKFLALSYTLDGKEYKSYDHQSLKDFYEKLRKKVDCKTSCINQYTFEEAFEEELKKGNDILYICFSSNLSGTYLCAHNASLVLNEKYKNEGRKVLVVDSLSAALGEGLLVMEAVKQKEMGKSIDEVYKFCEDLKLKIDHAFTVDDLSYLYKGGRLKATAYLIASLVNIKPLMRVNDEGRLVAYSKTIGRKRSIMGLVERMAKKIDHSEDQTIYIVHGDCIDDVNLAIRLINSKMKVKDIVVNLLEPVIGTHSGPGTLAIFYKAKNRD